MLLIEIADELSPEAATDKRTRKKHMHVILANAAVRRVREDDVRGQQAQDVSTGGTNFFTPQKTNRPNENDGIAPSFPRPH